jgi:small subunit ribosomal protein S6
MGEFILAAAGRPRCVEVHEERRMANRQYELVYILPPDTTEQQVTDLHGQVEAVVSRMHGQIEKTDNWGRKKLAYEIGHNKEGVYVLDVINGSGELMKELDRRLKVIDQVIRHMIVRVDEEKKVVERTQTKRRTESERRRVKRGLPPQRQPGEGRQAGELDEPDDDRFDGVEV